MIPERWIGRNVKGCDSAFIHSWLIYYRLSFQDKRFTKVHVFFLGECYMRDWIKVAEKHIHYFCRKIWKKEISSNIHIIKSIIKICSCTRQNLKGRRRRKQLLHGLKEVIRYWKLKKEALDRTLWRIRFGRGFGFVVRHTALWMYDVQGGSNMTGTICV